MRCFALPREPPEQCCSTGRFLLRSPSTRAKYCLNPNCLGNLSEKSTCVRASQRISEHESAPECWSLSWRVAAPASNCARRAWVLRGSDSVLALTNDHSWSGALSTLRPLNLRYTNCLYSASLLLTALPEPDSWIETSPGSCYPLLWKCCSGGEQWSARRAPLNHPVSLWLALYWKWFGTELAPFAGKLWRALTLTENLLWFWTRHSDDAVFAYSYWISDLVS